MSDPVYVYVGTYASEPAAKSDLEVVRGLHRDDVLRTYDAAVVTRDAEGKVHVRRHERSTEHGVEGGAAVGALVGLLFPPAFLAATVVGAAATGIAAQLWRGLSRADLKDLGDVLDAGEAALVVVSTSELDHIFAAALKALTHQVKKLEKADAKAFEAEVEKVGELADAES